MKSVRVEYQLEVQQRSATVIFLRDLHNRWMADISIEGIDGSTHLGRDQVGSFHPCQQHAQRLVWTAIGRQNSGRRG